MMSPKGYLLLWFSLFATLILFVFSKLNFTVPAANPLLFLSQILALIGTILLAFTFLLSSRLPFLVSWFGPFNQIYRLHHFLGGISFVLLLHHPLLLALQNPSFPGTISLYTLIGRNLIYDTGLISLYLLILSLFFTFLVKLPHSLWLITHQFLGLALIFASIHVFFIQSDVSRYLPLRFWILSWLVLALVAFIYKKFLSSSLAPKIKSSDHK